MFTFLFMFGFNPGQSDEDGREHREYHRLDEADQTLQAHHKDAHDDTEGRHRQLYGHGLTGHEEDDTSDGHRDGMACHHVGEKSDHQGEGLGEDTHELDDGDDGDGRLEPRGHLGPEDVLPVVFVARELHDKESAEGEEERHGDVARHVA